MNEKARPSQSVIHDFGEGPSLAASRCSQCGETRYPPRTLCVNDLTPMDLVPVSSVGELAESAWISRPPYGFEKSYYACYVDMPEGIRVFGMIDDAETEPAHGDRFAWSIAVVRTKPEPVLGPLFHRAEPPRRPEDASTSSA